MTATTPTLSTAVLAILLSCAVAPLMAQAQQPGITRTELQRHDLSVPGREVVQVRVDFAPGAAFPRHSHPGEEIVYALGGVMEYRLDGRPGARPAPEPGRQSWSMDSMDLFVDSRQSLDLIEG